MNLLSDISKAFSGRKTYLVAGAMAIAVFCLQMGWIDQKTYELIIGVLLPTSIATLRAGVSK